MAQVLRQPAEWRMSEWREKAAVYFDRAVKAEDFRLRQQFTELAARHFDMAARLEGERRATVRQILLL